MNDIDILFKNNEKLVYFVINKYFYNLPKDSSYDIDDWKQIGFVGLLKACKTYKENFKTTFSTYAIPVIRNEILQTIRKIKHSNITDSLYDIIYDEIAIIDILEYNEEEQIFTRIYLDDIKNYINSKFQEKESKIMMDYIFNGMTQMGISIKYKISQAQVSRIIKKFKDNYNKDSGGEIK